VTAPPAPEAAAAAERRLVRGSGGRLWRLPGAVDFAPFEGAEWPRFVSRLLIERGVHSMEEARTLLSPPAGLVRPADLPQLDVAVERLARACREGERVAIFGDFDVDGVTSTAILVEALSALGAEPLPYLPHRMREGYGPNVAAIRQLADRGASVLVTADCGTSAVDEIAEANALGMDALVLDHHTIPPELPDALAIVNPKLDGATEGAEPAACGIAYTVAHRLHEELGVPYDPEPHAALAALGTVCDLAPMVGENRELVRAGLEALSRATRPGLRALAAAASASLVNATPDLCGWVLGPRINAAGRMDHARLALELLLAPTEEEAMPLAQRLDALNRERRDETAAAREELRTLLSEEERAAPIVIAASSMIAAGIVGPLASRLVDEHGRPAIVMQLVDGEGRASCRSIPGFDITALLRRHEGLFLRYGGHRAAAGFSIEAGRLPEVRRALIADAAERLDPQALAPTIEVDAALPLEQAHAELLSWLARLGPHGVGNAVPTFVAPGVRIESARVVGSDRSHLQFNVRAGAVSWRAISFGNAQHLVEAGERADIVYRFREDTLRGGLQLEVLDLRPTAPHTPEAGAAAEEHARA
jgi:single-stranded-DNA-specific exonuclease